MERRQRSFSETALVEAVARLATVYLVVRPVTPGGPKRLSSRFVGMDAQGQLVLAAPAAQGHKVFLPPGWQVGISFPMGQVILQARTHVLGHCQFPQRPPRRVDAVVVACPARLTALNQRSHPRHKVSQSTCIQATVWRWEDLAVGRCEPLAMGRVHDTSQGGVGILFDRELGIGRDTEVVLRLEEKGALACSLYRGSIKHCTGRESGGYLVGFGQVREVRPGEAVAIVESMIAAR